MSPALVALVIMLGAVLLSALVALVAGGAPRGGRGELW